MIRATLLLGSIPVAGLVLTVASLATPATPAKSEIYSPPEALKVIHETPNANEALLNFNVGTKRSSLRKVSGRWPRLWLTLSRMPFGQLGRDVLARPAWRIVADDELFRTPFAALARTGGPSPEHLAERYQIRQTQGAPASITEPENPLDGLFWGIGGGACNRAPWPERPAARAFSAATLDMLDSGTLRTRPESWATFLAVEKE